MIESAFIIAFIVHFLHACTWEGMIFSPITERLWNLPHWIKMPLFGCPICMTPWWGALMMACAVIITGYPVGGNEVFLGLMILFTAAGINAVFVQLFPHHETN